MPLTDSDTGSDSEGDLTYKPTSKVKTSELVNRVKTRSFKKESKSEGGTASQVKLIVEDAAEGLKRSIAISDLSSVENLTDLFNTKNSIVSSEDSEGELEVNMGENEDIKAMRQSFEEIVNTTKLNDTRRLPELPYFGSTNEGESSKLWTIKDCVEFLKYIEDATVGPSFNDSGRIEVCRSKLLGTPRNVFRKFDKDTWEEAKAYLKEHYPSANTYQKASRELNAIRRKKGERITDLAGRIDLAYDKIERVAPALAEGRDIQRKEILLSLLPPSVRTHVDLTEDYTEMVVKIINYLETNPQYKLTEIDIDNEGKNGAIAINVVKDKVTNNGNKNTNEQSNGSTKSKNTGSLVLEPVVANIQTSNQSQSSRHSSNANSNEFRGGGSFRGRGTNFRGNVSGNAQEHVSFRGNGRGRGREMNNNNNNQGSNRGNNNNSNRGVNNNWGNYNRNRGYYNHTRRGFDSNIQCHNCNEWGHIARECPEQNNRIRCYNCNKWGHISRECKIRYNSKRWY